MTTSLFSGGLAFAQFFVTVSAPYVMALTPNTSIVTFQDLLDEMKSHMLWWGEKAEEGLSRGFSIRPLMTR